MGKYNFDPAMNLAGAVGYLLGTIGLPSLDAKVAFGVEAMTVSVFYRFFQLKVFGQENVPTSGACIFGVAPHSSDLDGPVAAVASGRRLQQLAFGVAKDRFYSTPGRSYFSRKIINTIPVERRGFSRSSLVDSREVLKSGKGLVIMVEGTRQGSDGQTIRSCKSGAAELAIEMGCPLIPTRILGAFEAFPWNARLPKGRGPITVIFGQPIMPIEFNGVDRKELTALLEQQICKLSVQQQQQPAPV